MIQGYVDKLTGFFVPFTRSQLLYFLALVVLMFKGFTLEQDSMRNDFLFWPGMIAIAGLAIEIWPKFVSLWESILGRVFIVTVYVVLANFAIAMAGQKVNQIVGVDPSNMFYTVGFVTLLMAPIWIVIVTVIGMLFYMIVTQIIFIIALFFSLIRVKLNVSFNKVKLPKTTMFAKLMLVPIMMSSLIVVLAKYGSEFAEVSVFDSIEEVAEVAEQIEKEQKEQLLTDSSQGEVTPVEQQQQPPHSITLNPNVGGIMVNGKVATPTQLDDLNPLIDKEKTSSMDKLVAKFVYWIEAYEFSQCEKQAEQRVMFIGENDILVVTPNSDAVVGYEFKVVTCQLKHS